MNGPSIIPENEGGASSDVMHEITAADIASAAALFSRAKQRLLNVNQWHQLCGTGSAVFTLTDEKGNEVLRDAQLGDHFKIDIPGPASVTGKGNDWVQVEAVEHTVKDNEEVLAIRVRPSDNPQSHADAIAHFFSDEASSTFSVTRKDNLIIASVQGRNEKPNLKSGTLADTLRNAIVGAGAIMGLNKPQWKSLVKGLLQE